jgi:hypothetical protein
MIDNMIEEIRINRSSVIRWFYNEEHDFYIVDVNVYNRNIYHKHLDKKHYNIFHNYINERIKYLIGEGILHKDYTMILLDNTMYKVIDHFHFMELMRYIVPVDGLERDKLEDNLFDLVLDATLRTGEIFDDNDLVYHNGMFYYKGSRILDINDFKRDGIEYEEYDLLHGLNEEQMDYINYTLYYLKEYNSIEYYVTEEVKLKIDR